MTEFDQLLEKDQLADADRMLRACEHLQARHHDIVEAFDPALDVADELPPDHPDNRLVATFIDAVATALDILELPPEEREGRLQEEIARRRR